MNGDPPILTVELLNELRARWQAAGSPIVDRLRPGLEDAEMDEITEPLGLSVPPEARVWWGWHNGSERFEALTGLGYSHYPLEQAVAEAIERREIAERIAGDDADPALWRWAWLPLTVNRHGGLIAVDGGPATVDSPISPVFYTEAQFGAEDARPRARSLGEMVTWWLEAFDTGVYQLDRERNRLTYHLDRLDVDRERTRLV